MRELDLRECDPRGCDSRGCDLRGCDLRRVCRAPEHLGQGRDAVAPMAGAARSGSSPRCTVSPPSTRRAAACSSKAPRSPP
ncbi:hypothetical protein GT040_32600 [Streptomyces sp. SID2119]|nr:hypothetical protein [Streptomyces sp. SID2119]